ncbi:MAG: hypothetical protein KY437_02360 [Actinobacteria bacterium]|nr:hypothetical protein [Actinomycetota bacterium]
MSWILLIITALVLANLAAAFKSASRVPVRLDTEEERLRRAVAERRAAEEDAAA